MIKKIHKAIDALIDNLITYRAMPTQSIEHIDPFLFLNHHGPQVYPPNNQGLPFGPHPHRGFETLTFILEGDLMHYNTGSVKSIIKLLCALFEVLANETLINTRIEKSYNWYWGYIPAPITESRTIQGSTSVSYLLSLTIKFLDVSEIGRSKLPPVVWQASISQKSSKELLINNECRRFFELLLYQFPQVWKENPEQFLYEYYTFTGIVYNKNDLRIIFNVLPVSPAEKAGLRKGDIIMNIDGDKIPSKYEDLINLHYRDWITNLSPTSLTEKTVNKTGRGFGYLIWTKGGLWSREDDTPVCFKISRNGNNMDIQLIPIKKQ